VSLQQQVSAMVPSTPAEAMKALELIEASDDSALVDF
jgi:hypothetical protein